MCFSLIDIDAIGGFTFSGSVCIMGQQTTQSMLLCAKQVGLKTNLYSSCYRYSFLHTSSL